MFFRTFGDFENPPKKHLYDFWQESEKLPHIDGIPDNLGKGIIFSDSINFNSRCSIHGDHYREYNMKEHDNWRSFFADTLKFMCEYPDIGVATFHTGYDTSTYYVVTEHASLNAYKPFGKGGINPFFIIFNAMPTKNRFNNYLRVGYDRYAIDCNQKSVIVWNLDDYKDLPCLEDFTIWGVEHGAKGDSQSGDVLVGYKNGEYIYL
ncbi:MAG: hypothetical protein MJ154_00765 [Candidatus Saccharibacteria bacterium]|nr:hypothetical protein [Candidatus Saccharibacteria bacterium]